MSRIPKWQNQRTGQLAEGVRDGDELLIRRARGSLYAYQGEPVTQPGDVWHLAADPQQAFIVLEPDSQAATLPSKRLRHLALKALPVAGQLTISRPTAARNDFGRRTEGLQPVVTDVPAAIDQPSPGNLAVSPAGLDPLTPRTRFVVTIDPETAPLVNDTCLFNPIGSPAQVSMRIVHVAPQGGTLWRIEAV